MTRSFKNIYMFIHGSIDCRSRILCYIFLILWKFEHIQYIPVPVPVIYIYVLELPFFNGVSNRVGRLLNLYTKLAILNFNELRETGQPAIDGSRSWLSWEQESFVHRLDIFCRLQRPQTLFRSRDIWEILWQTRTFFVWAEYYISEISQTPCGCALVPWSDRPGMTLRKCPIQLVNNRPIIGRLSGYLSSPDTDTPYQLPGI